MRIGILGGSFNPPHRAHLKLAETVLDLGLVDRVCFIPTSIPPHKVIQYRTSPEMRLAMTRLLAGDDPRLSVDPIELSRSGPSYSLDTVRELMGRNPDNRYRLIIGSDMAKSFSSWLGYKDLLRLAPPLVAERPDDRIAGDDDFPVLTPDEQAVMASGRFPMPLMAVNSTLVRTLLQDGADDAALLPYLTEAVLGYIRKHGLYRKDDCADGGGTSIWRQ
ncbi:MAG: nicotinate (nicotinamide) nucleotide adenylyltransferase [Planctomycetaceae bacterium]|nr:nicotinate (nicotinamide) nucleotide adenylyltransferase [Planctomycetaceae bacterium]